MATVGTRLSWDGGLGLGTDGSATFDPPVDPGPTSNGTALISAVVVDDSTTTGPRSVPEVRMVSRSRVRYRILVGGKDVTYFRGVKTPMPNYSLIQPLLYGSGSLTFPQIHGALERPGHGDLAWLKKFSTVRVQRLADDGHVVATDYVGFISDFPSSGRDFTVTLGGQASGRAAMQDRPMVPFPQTNDIGGQVMRTIQHTLRLPIANSPTTGIELPESGGTGSQLDWITEIMAKSVQLDGVQWTVAPNSSGAYRMFRKDTTTIDATVYIDGFRVTEDLKRDFTEEPNRVWASGIDKDGRRIRFEIDPGLARSRPSFPGSLSPGDSGDGVTALIWRLYTVDYLDATPFGLDWTTDDDDPVTDAVMDVQQDAGLSQTGVVNEATWNAVFDPNVTGFSTRRASIKPAAQRPYTQAFLRNASGQILGPNPAYDRSRELVDRTIEVGTGFSSPQIQRFAKHKLADESGSNWQGTITVTTGAIIDGEHNPGDPLDSSGLRDIRSIKPGMNVWEPRWDGGTLFHVSGVNPSTGELTVDTRARDTMEVWEVIARNRESRRSPDRQWIAQNRRSGLRDDSGAFYDGGVFGKIERTFCPADEWTVVATPGGRSGILNLIDLQTTDDEAAFVLWISGRRVNPSWLNRKVGDPFATGFADHVQAMTKVWQDTRGLLEVFGQKDQPCGYWPGAHTGALGGETDAPITGQYRNEVGIPYLCQGSPVLWIGIRPDRDTYLQGGRVLDLLRDDAAG